MPVKFTRPRFVFHKRNSGTERSLGRIQGKRRSVPTTFSRQARDATEHLGVRKRTSSGGRGSVPTNVRRRIEPPRTRRQRKRCRIKFVITKTYRLNKKTPLQVASKFGMITLRSFYYLNEQDGEPGLHPLRVRLGIGARLGDAGVVGTRGPRDR